VRTKKLGIKRRKKVRKTFFLYSHEYRAEKMGGKKRAKQFFQKHSNKAVKKCWEKKTSEKSANNVFLYSHEYRAEKIGGQKGVKTFFKKQSNNASKKCL